MRRGYVVVFAKAPRLGAVKTRLARDVGRLAAWRFYRQTTLALLRRLARDRRWTTVLAVTPDAAATAPYWPAGVRRIGQGRGDLGRRMRRAFAALPPGPAVIVGCDIPALRPHHIARAFRALGRAEAVFGPANDGGYWLIGLKRMRATPDLFRDVRWSTSHALADTRRNLGTRTVVLIDELIDIDTLADLRQWRAEMRAG